MRATRRRLLSPPFATTTRTPERRAKRQNIAPSILRQATAYWDTRYYSGSGNLTNLGTGGSALNLVLPGGTNDPTYLAYAGEKYAYLPGIAGNYASTPDSAAVSVTGDIDLCVRVALTDWTPAATCSLIGKNTAADPNRDFMLNVVATTGLLQAVWSPTGAAAAQISKSSTVAPTVADGAALWVRVTIDVDNGAAGNDVKFYTAPDSASIPSSWTQLGTTVTTAGTTSIHDGTAVLSVGAVGSGATQPVTGKVYRALVYSGIGGTLVADYDPSRSVEPHATFTASTGEVWTQNRAASGRKLALVDGPMELLGTDDWNAVTDPDSIDFTGAQSFTYQWCGRVHDTTANQCFLAKKADQTTAAGWQVDRGTGNAPRAVIADGTASVTATGPALTQGNLSVVTVVRDVDADTLTVYSNATAGTPVNDTTTATLANAVDFRLGRLSGAGTAYLDATARGAAVYGRKLSAAEVAQTVREWGVNT